VRAAATGAAIIVHIGAALRGSAAFMDDTAVSGTANVAEVAQAAGVGQVVYLSSLTVYDFLSMRNGDVIGPGSPLESVPRERGSYTVAKRQAEDIALEQLRRGQPPWTILRPSVFFGNGLDPKTLVGFGLGRWLVCPGRPRRPLLLVHVKDVASAILLAIESPQAKGKIYTLSHPDTVRLGEYLRTSVQRDGPRWRVVYVPHTVAYGAMLAATAMGRLLGRRLNISPRRLASLYREVLVDATGIQQDLGWVPANGLVAELEAEATTCGALKPVVA
jgi:nucleoside-diphosphate-sugar epimerase